MVWERDLCTLAHRTHAHKDEASPGLSPLTLGFDDPLPTYLVSGWCIAAFY